VEPEERKKERLPRSLAIGKRKTGAHVPVCSNTSDYHIERKLGEDLEARFGQDGRINLNEIRGLETVRQEKIHYQPIDASEREERGLYIRSAEEAQSRRVPRRGGRRFQSGHWVGGYFAPYAGNRRRKVFGVEKKHTKTAPGGYVCKEEARKKGGGSHLDQ